MPSFRTLGVLLAAAVTAALLQPAPASGATIPDASVKITEQAREGPRGTILASLQARCAPGFEVADLIIDFEQGAVDTPPSSGPSFPCDGEWHRLSVSSDEAYEPGPATMSARLSVTDIDTGDPGQQAFQSRTIFVRAAAVVQLPATATLKPHGYVKVVVRARCDKPWVLSDLIVSVSQDGNFGSRSLTIPCDGWFRQKAAWIRSAGPTPFHRGQAQADASLSVLDPESFDPVTTATASRLITVQ